MHRSKKYVCAVFVRNQTLKPEDFITFVRVNAVWKFVEVTSGGYRNLLWQLNKNKKRLRLPALLPINIIEDVKIFRNRQQKEELL